MTASDQKVDKPALALAVLILEHTGVEVQTYSIRKLIKDHFTQLSALAHQIHDEEVEYAKVEAYCKDEN